jgi:hypothetical protein
MFRVLTPYVDFFRVLFFLWKRTLSPFWGTEKKRDHKIVRLASEREDKTESEIQEREEEEGKKKKKIFVFYIYIRTR